MSNKLNIDTQTLAVKQKVLQQARELGNTNPKDTSYYQFRLKMFKAIVEAGIPIDVAQKIIAGLQAQISPDILSDVILINELVTGYATYLFKLYTAYKEDFGGSDVVFIESALRGTLGI